MLVDPPEIEIERSWIHTGMGQEANLICNVHAEPSANVKAQLLDDFGPSACSDAFLFLSVGSVVSR